MTAARAGGGAVEPPPHSFDGLLAAVLEGRTTMWCEIPLLDGSATVAEHLAVRGWAHSREGLESVTVTFDGQPLLTKTGFSRPDVDRALTGIEGGVSGFVAHLDVRRCRRGEHRLAVVARGRDGRAIGREAPVTVDPDLPYRRWLEGLTPPSPSCSSASALEVVVVGAGDEALTRSAADQGPGVVRHADLPSELRRLAASGTGTTVLLESGGVLAPHALARLSEAMDRNPAPDLVYADEDAVVADGGRGTAFLKPGWSPELLIATDYVGPLVALSSRAARAALEAAPTPPATLYEAVLALVDAPLVVSRVPEPLYTAHSIREPADDDGVTAALDGVAARRGGRLRTSPGVRRGMRQVGWEVDGNPLVSIVIPSRYARGLLRDCLASIAQRSTYRRLEVVVVDSSGGEVAAALPALGDIPHRVVTYEGDFNYSRAVNLGARRASGEHLLFLNDDTEILTPESIERLLEHAQSAQVGAVGCKLVYDDGTIQHGGVGVASGARGAWHLYLGFDGDEPGYRDTLTVARNTSAVTAACMMVSTSAFAEIGGFDEAYPLDYGDTDFCLRALDAGRRIVFTPHAVLLHRESATRTPHLDDAGRELSAHWSERFAHGDPFLHPAFAEGHSYFLDASAPPRPVRPETARSRITPMPGPTTPTQLEAPVLRCDPSLEEGPVYFHNELVVSGWTLAPAEILELKIELDGRSLEVDTGRDTPAATEDHPESDRAKGAGFEARMDCRDWERGEHVLAVTAVDREGRRTGHRSPVRIDPYELPPGSFEEIKAAVTSGSTVMWCDEPALDGTAAACRELTVRGWAHGRDGLEHVLVTLDRRHRYEAILGHKRADLARSLAMSELANAGFEVNLDVREQIPGDHHLSVVAVGGDGRLVGVEGVVRFESGPAPTPAAAKAPRPAAGGDGPRERPSPERLVPEAAAGRLVVAEHQTRYRWAAQAARGRDALDAGCGVGYGAAILAHAGARSVTGVDRSPEAIFNARERAGESAEFLLADLQEMPFEEGSFDLITCFEAIEHIVDRERALDELRRLLRPGGLLLISSPHRGVYAPGNPHHVHEYTPSELREALSARFKNVALYCQNAHLASLLCDDDGFRSSDAEQVLDADARKIAAADGGELYTVAAAGDGELPVLRGVAVLGEVFDYKELAELAWALEERAIVAEADASASRTEASLSAAARERAEELLQDSERARREAEHGLAALQASISWRITAPLRWAKARARARARL